MASINLPTIPRISDADLDDVKERRRIMNYLMKLDEQLRYMMTHLGEENFSQETVEAIRNGGASVESIRSLQTELGQNTTKIEQTAEHVESVAQYTGYNDDSGYTTTLKSRIEQNATNIQNKVEASVYNTKMGQVDQAISTVTQTADALKVTVESTIRNEIRNSAFWQGLTYWTKRSTGDTLTYGSFGSGTTMPYYTLLRNYGLWTIQSANGIYVSTSNVWEAGVTYTASFWAQTSAPVTLRLSRSRGDYGEDIQVSGTWKRYSTTITCTSTTNAGTLSIDAVNPTAGTQLYITGVMLQRGELMSMWCPHQEDPTDKLLNASAEINSQGIFMQGGVIDMQAGTQFNVRSGGKINLEATGGGSNINLGGKFTVTEAGDVAAASGSFDSLAVNNQRVLTLSDIGIPIKVAANQPTGSNFIWVQPTGGGSVSSVRYTGYTAPSRNNDVNFGINNPISRSFTSEDGVSTLSGSTYTYELEFEIYSLSSFTGVTFSATATKGGSTVTFDASSAITLNKYNHPVIKLTKSGTSVNLASSASAITVAITATASPGRDGLFLQSQQNMTLTISTTSSGSGVQTCNVKYVP